PVWVSPTPPDRSRFDMVLPNSTSFTMKAVDPEGDPITFVTRQSPIGSGPDTADGFSCTQNPAAPGQLSCSVVPKKNGLVIFSVYAQDANGAISFVNEYVVGASTYRYVALGDSYSAGEGVDPYFEDGWGPHGDNRCHRSTRSYAEYVRRPHDTYSLYERASGAPGTRPGSGKTVSKYGSDHNERFNTPAAVDWIDWACSGATTENVTTISQDATEDPNNTEDYFDTQFQLDHDSIDPSTDLVTISIGGNDMHFSDRVTECALHACLDGARGDEWRGRVQWDLDHVGPKLVATVNAIKAKTFNARIIVVGYPYLFPGDAAEQACPSLAPFWGEMDTIRQYQDRFLDVLQQSVRSAGAEYVDVRAAFAHHEPCGNQGAWMNPAHVSPHDFPPVSDESFHPTLTGQQFGYAAAINAYLANQPVPPRNLDT